MIKHLVVEYTLKSVTVHDMKIKDEIAEKICGIHPTGKIAEIEGTCLRHLEFPIGTERDINHLMRRLNWCGFTTLIVEGDDVEYVRSDKVPPIVPD